MYSRTNLPEASVRYSQWGHVDIVIGWTRAEAEIDRDVVTVTSQLIDQPFDISSAKQYGFAAADRVPIREDVVLG